MFIKLKLVMVTTLNLGRQGNLKKDALIIKAVGSVFENAGFNFSLFNSTEGCLVYIKKTNSK